MPRKIYSGLLFVVLDSVKFSKFQKISLVVILVFSWLLSAWPQIWKNPPIPLLPKIAFASNYLTNQSFTGGTTGWTLSTTAYDSSYYQDSAGSVKTATLVGRNKTATGYAEQTIGTNINSNDIVKLSLYWSKQCVAATCTTNTITVDIAKPSVPTTWVTIWSDTSTPVAGSATAWTGPSNLDVSSYFDETGQYKFRVYANLGNPNNASAQSLAWFDNLNLDVTTVTISVSVSDGVVSYGIMPANTSKSTLPGELNDMQTATNNGDVTENFNIKGQDASGGGCTWTLAGTAGNNQYIHQFCNDTDLDCTSPPTNYTALTTNYQALDTGIVVSGTVDFQLRLTTPNPSSCYGQQLVEVTIQAVQ